MKNPYEVIKNPISTEKAVRIMEAENKLIFVVQERSTKKDIKDALQTMFKVKVVKVNTLVLPDGRKKAYVKLSPETPALDIATQLGMM